SMPPEAPVPRFLFEYDDGVWVALGFEDVDGRQPAVPWTRADLDRVLDAVARLHAALTPAPVAAPAIGDRLGPPVRHWRDLTAGVFPIPDGLEPWAATNLERLASLESDWADAARGTTLLHADLRADNVLLTDDRVVFVDWPTASIGAAWVD